MERLMTKVTKHVCRFLGADLDLVKVCDNERMQDVEYELNSLCNILQKIIINGTDLSWYDLGGSNEHSRCNTDD